MKNLSHKFIVYLCQKVFTILIIQHILYFSDFNSSKLELDKQKNKIITSKITASKMIANRMTASRIIASRMTATFICVKTY